MYIGLGRHTEITISTLRTAHCSLLSGQTLNSPGAERKTPWQNSSFESMGCCFSEPTAQGAAHAAKKYSKYGKRYSSGGGFFGVIDYGGGDYGGGGDGGGCDGGGGGGCGGGGCGGGGCGGGAC